MGWTVGSARYFKNGKVDRKAECDALCTDTVFRVEKSAMVGAVYYAAIRRKHMDILPATPLVIRICQKICIHIITTALLAF